MLDIPAASQASRASMPFERRGFAPLKQHALTSVMKLEGSGSPKWLFAFISIEIGCQLSLYFFGDTFIRTPMRIAAFASSLAFFFAIRNPMRRPPAFKFARWIPIILLAGLLHPERNTLLASIASIALYFSILAPIFWVPRLRISMNAFRWLVLTLWFFQMASASMAVLQTKYPGRFQGAVPLVRQESQLYQQGQMVIVLANGEMMLRPMGLTDSPGGAAWAGLYVVLFGLAFLVTERNRGLQLLVIAGMIAGTFCVLMSQTRSSVVMTGVCAIMFAGSLAMRRDWDRVAKIVLLVVPVAVVGAVWAFSVGGATLSDRLGSLTADDPGTVFHQNRGQFIEWMIENDLPQYPFGAGLGRWGMVNMYFGDPSTSLYSEMIWSSWLYDGGVPLMIVYAGALLVTTFFAFRVATNQKIGKLAFWGGLIFSYDIAVLAATVVFPVFCVQFGMEFWMLNGAFFAMAANESRQRAELATQ